MPCLVGEQDEEGSHESKETGGFGNGETHHSVSKELTYFTTDG